MGIALGLVLPWFTSPGALFAETQYDFQFFLGHDRFRVLEARERLELADGSLWVGTWGDGVHRIHEADWQEFGPEDGLTTDWTRGLAADAQGNVWVGGWTGVHRIVGPRVVDVLRSENTPGLPDSFFGTIEPLSDGRILAVGASSRVASSPTMLFTPSEKGALTGTWSVIATLKTFRDGKPIGFAEFPTGEVVAAITTGGLYRWDGAEWHDFWRNDKRWLLRETECDGERVIWAAEQRGREIHRLTTTSREKVATAPSPIQCFQPLSEGEILIGTDGGLVLFSRGHWRPMELPHEIGKPNVRTLLRSRAGILWIGAREGLIRATPRTWQGEATTVDGVAVDRIVQGIDPDGPLWALDRRRRLVRFENESWHPFLELDVAETRDSHAIGIWAFGEESYAYVLRSRSIEQYSLQDGKLRSRLEIPQGHGPAPPMPKRLCWTSGAELLLLTDQGVYQRQSGVLVPFPAPSEYRPKHTFDLVELSAHVYLAAVKQGTELWKTDGFETLENPTRSDVHSIHVGRRGSVWLGSVGAGVLRYDGKQTVVTDFSKRADSQLVTGVYEARDGMLWVSFRRGGVASYRDGRWVTYLYEHGLPNRDVEAIREDERGSIWVSIRTGGLYRFQPETAPPDTKIEPAPREVASHGIAAFSFTGWDAWNQTPSQNLVYGWRILREPGGESVTKWSQWDRKLVIVTPALKPGRYRFEVRASDENRNVDATPATHVFEVQTALWRRPEFVAPVASLGIVSVLAIVMSTRTRERRKRAERERAESQKARDELERRVVQRTTELKKKNAELERYAYTVSHDLKNPLVSIKGFLGIMREDLSQRNVDAARENLAVVDAAADTMGQLIQDLLEFSRLGHTPQTLERVDLSELIANVMHSLTSAIESRGARVEVRGELPTYAEIGPACPKSSRICSKTHCVTAPTNHSPGSKSVCAISPRTMFPGQSRFTCKTTESASRPNTTTGCSSCLKSFPTRPVGRGSGWRSCAGSSRITTDASGSSRMGMGPEQPSV